VREDDLLASLRTHVSQLSGDDPATGQESHDVVAFLRANQMAIACGASAWDLSISSDNTVRGRRATPQNEPVGINVSEIDTVTPRRYPTDADPNTEILMEAQSGTRVRLSPPPAS